MLKTSNTLVSHKGVERVYRTRVWCPNRKSDDPIWMKGMYTGSAHEFYSWINTDPDLPAFLQPIKVGDMGPTERGFFYFSVLAVVLFLAIVLLASLVGGCNADIAAALKAIGR